jgi:hypothetical protein
MRGSGGVRDLREAASLQTAAGQLLTERLTAYASAITRAQQRPLLPDLVDAWSAGGEGALQPIHGSPESRRWWDGGAQADDARRTAR